jgi:hypothetical protein
MSCAPPKYLFALVLLFIVTACDPLMMAILEGHDVDLDKYVGKWRFESAIYPGAEKYIPGSWLELNSDSSFTANFSFFFDRDSSLEMHEVSGKWSPYLGASDPHEFYIQFTITIAGRNKLWHVNGGNSTSRMTWVNRVSDIEEIVWFKITSL